MIDAALYKKLRLQYFFDRSNYTVAPGGTVAVTVFVQETVKPSDDSSLLGPGRDGLIRGGVVVQVGLPAPTKPARVRSTSAIAGNSGFDLAIIPQIPSPSTSACAGILELSQSPVFGEVVSRSATCQSVLLPIGTFTFTAGPVAGEVTFLTAMAMEDAGDIAGGSNVTNSGIVLDPVIQPGTAMITVSKSVRIADSVRELGAAAEANLIGRLRYK
jgi:hypothetical protein